MSSGTSRKSCWERSAWRDQVRRTMRVRPRIYTEALTVCHDPVLVTRVADAIESTVPYSWESTAISFGEAEIKRRVETVQLWAKLNIDPGILRDSQWAMAQFEATRFADYPKNYVAIFKEAVVGSGNDEMRLRDRLARQFGVPPERFVVKYKGPWH